ncbi:nucleotide sugar dehydrogenase [Peribacillus alkalitolerans]|uniref:nucleotide sugar dehydrogenase n=1 Tax=Peribacillus alkalitolerans TaxID=1550385 RepID=UPI0013D635A9|nr:nucleotide sugar dehydrogenase [Peribacillus alkalitolerans]
MKNIAVVGLGKIGLTLAAVFANSGHYRVFGADINEEVVKTVNKGISHVSKEPGLEELLEEAHKRQTLIATTRTSEAVSNAEIVVVIVPVLVNEQNEVYYHYIDSAVEEIGKGVKKGTLVIFETTLPTGDTRNRFGKRIEQISGLKMGTDFYLGYSPERVYSNRIIADLANYPKVIGGLDEKSLQLATEFYQKALKCDVLQVSSLETAEFTKVAESVYRDVNIALVNELAVYADRLSVNIKEVIKAANSEPFSHLHSPGVGVGGHCIPVYPYFFINNGLEKGLVTLSRKINDMMANYAVQAIEDAAGSLNQQNVLILGIAFRENVKEHTKSSTLLLIKELQLRGANVYVDDPLYTDGEISSFGVKPFTKENANEIGVIVLQAFHDEYKNFDFKRFSNCKFILDGRNVLDKKEIEGLGISYKGIGVN